MTPTGYLVLFNRYGNTLAAVWDTEKKSELFLPKPWKQGRDMMGRPVKEPAASTVDISPSPLFVEFPGLDFYNVKNGTALQLQQGKDFPLPFSPVWTPRPLTVENGRLRIPADALKGPYLLLGKVDEVWQALTVHVNGPLDSADGK